MSHIKSHDKDEYVQVFGLIKAKLPIEFDF